MHRILGYVLGRRHRRLSTFSGLALGIVMSLIMVNVALADNVQNNVTVNGTDTFTAGGSTGISYRIVATSGDGEIGCNATVASPATVTINAPAVVTATPSSQVFTACGGWGDPVTFSSSTPGNYQITVSVSDSGPGTYNVQPATFTLKVLAPADSTPPTASPTQSPAANANGWNNSNVTVSWNWADNTGGSGIDTANCTTSTMSSGEGAAITLQASCKDLAGNTGNASYVVKVDKTAPTISGSAAPAPNGNGWNNTDVAVSFACTDDGGSGVATCGPDQTLSAQGGGQTANGTATDYAGNSASTTVGPINIDKTAPSATPAASPAPNANGWNNGDVDVDWNWSDTGGSGIDTGNCTISSTSSGEGELTLGASCADEAGNTGNASHIVKVDTTDPTISGSASPAPNGNGWSNDNVTVSFTCGDGGSGVASCGPNQTLSGEGGGQSATGTATDNAGNSASTTVGPINIDKTAPSVAVTGVSNGAHYYLGSVPAAGCATTDGLSGVNTEASLTSSGGIGPGVGTITATCSGAEDKAGNGAAAVSATYTVGFHYSGLFRPVDNLPTVNRVKAGSAIPVKFSLAGNHGLGVLMAGFPKTSSMTCNSAAPVDPVDETVSASSSVLQYDAASDQYTYVWKTDRSWSGCRVLVVKLIDGTEVRANFTFTK